MSEPAKKSPKKLNDRKRKQGEKATELPDDQAIRKLFPKKVVDEVNKEIEHKPDSDASD